nr:hypothetical protein [uncultured Agathobaculum sp.]
MLGYRPRYLLYKYLVHKKQLARELLYADIAIRTKYSGDLSSVLFPYIVSARPANDG